MIDFHTHILHNIDDGARTIDEALAMAWMAAEDGIKTMVATPHSPITMVGRHYTVELVQTRLAELRAALHESRIAIEIVPGTELYYHPQLPTHLKQGVVLPCGTQQAVLVECATSALPDKFDQLVFDLQVAGYRVVLAHPERIKTVQKQPNILLPLVERGVLMQITAQALLGRQGTLLQRVSETLLTHNMGHLIASDAHGAPPRCSRTPRLTEARNRAVSLVGEAAAQALVEDTPAALLSGAELNLPEPESVQSQTSWFWPWWWR